VLTTPITCPWSGSPCLIRSWPVSGDAGSVDSRTWDGEDITFETSLDMAIVAVIVGAQNTGLSELLAIIPRLDAGSICPMCRGRRYAPSPSGTDDDRFCFMCFGRGEVDERLVALAKENGVWE